MPPMPPMGPGGRKPGGPHGARLTMERPKDAKNTLKKLIGYIGRNRYLFFALIGVMLIITLLNLVAPSIQQIAIDCITLTKKKTSVDFGALGRTLIRSWGSLSPVLCFHLYAGNILCKAFAVHSKDHA